MAKGQVPAPKASLLEKEERITQCYKWLLNGYTRNKALRKGSQLWGVSTRTVDDYFTHAQKILSAQYAEKRDNILSELDAKLEYIYDKCLIPHVVTITKHGDEIIDIDRSNARLALMDRAKLAGLSGPSSVIKNTVNVTATPPTPDLIKDVGQLLYAEFHRLKEKQIREGLTSEDVNSLAKITKSLMDIKESVDKDTEAKKKQLASMSQEQLVEEGKRLLKQMEVKEKGEVTNESSPSKASKSKRH